MLEKSLGSNHATTVAGAQRYEAFRQSLMPELLDRFVTITSLSEFRDREFDQSVAEIRELLPLAPLREQSYEQIKDILLGVGLKAETEMVLRTGLEKFPESRLLRIYLAEVLSLTGRSLEALGMLEEASRLPRPGVDAERTDNSERSFFKASGTSNRVSFTVMMRSPPTGRRWKSPQGRQRAESNSARPTLPSTVWKKHRPNSNVRCGRRPATTRHISACRKRISLVASGRQRQPPPSAPSNWALPIRGQFICWGRP